MERDMEKRNRNRGEIMKHLTRLGAAILLLAGWVSADAAAAGGDSSPRVCINIHEIQSTQVPNDRTIIFHMRDGKVWQNRLRTVCPMLSVSPWTEIIHGPDVVCSNEQFIHVTQTGNDCVLGDFTPLAERSTRP
jgi:hypothetical protein